jgi:hypothetical protein
MSAVNKSYEGPVLSLTIDGSPGNYSWKVKFQADNYDHTAKLGYKAHGKLTCVTEDIPKDFEILVRNVNRPTWGPLLPSERKDIRALIVQLLKQAQETLAGHVK